MLKYIYCKHLKGNIQIEFTCKIKTIENQRYQTILNSEKLKK